MRALTIGRVQTCGLFPEAWRHMATELHHVVRDVGALDRGEQDKHEEKGDRVLHWMKK